VPSREFLNLFKYLVCNYTAISCDAEVEIVLNFIPKRRRGSAMDTEVTLKYDHRLASLISDAADDISHAVDSGEIGKAMERNGQNLKITGVQIGLEKTGGFTTGCDEYGNVVDQCNVCGGDGTSCAGCDMQANSGLEYDDCNVCDGQNKKKDCNGECFGSAVVDGCGVCAGGSSNRLINGTLDCAGTCDGAAEIDFCNVCYGGESRVSTENSTLDCNNVCDGLFTLGLCGDCYDPNLPLVSQMDCENTCLTSYTSAAVVCEGPKEKDPCDETANGRSADCFLVAGISPRSSSYVGGVKLTVKGKGFDFGDESKYLCSFERPGSDVFQDTYMTSQFVRISSIEGTCETPQIPDSNRPGGTQISWPDFKFMLQDHNNDNVISTASQNFTYFADGKAKLTSIDPTWGYVGRDTAVMISGTGFEGAFPDLRCYLRQDGRSLLTVPAAIYSDGVANCTLPAMASGISGPVEVYLLLNGMETELDFTNFTNQAPSVVTFSYKASAAAIESIRFTKDLRSLEVRWDQPIVDANSTDCIKYFSASTVEEHLQGSTCKLVTQRMLTVRLGPDARVAPYLRMTSNEDVSLLYHTKALTETGLSSKSVSAWPLDAVEPYADIQAPSIIPDCDSGNLVLSAAYSHGGGYRGLEYSWAVFVNDPKTVQSFNELLEKLDAQDKTVSKLEIKNAKKHFQKGVDYTFVLTVSSALSATANTDNSASVTIRRAVSESAASVRIKGPSVVSIGANRELVLRGEAINECYNSQDVPTDKRTYNWGIDLCVEDSCSSVESAGFSLDGVSSGPLLQLAANRLIATRRYRFRLTESPAADLTAATSATVLVDVLASELSCTVTGGNVQVSSESGSNLMLKAEVVGSDPKVAADAARWECKMDAGRACYLQTGGFARLQLPTGATATVPLANLHAGMYTFTAKPIDADGSVTTCTTTVTLVDGGISPIISIINAPTGPTIPNTVVRIEAKVTWPAGLELVTEFVSKSIEGDASSDVVVMDQTSLLTSAQVEHAAVGEFDGTSNKVTSVIVPLTFRSNALKAGVRYLFEISTRLPKVDGALYDIDLVDASASLVLEMASGATGSVTVEPASVAALSEYQTMSAVNFANADGTSNVAHTFYLQVDGREIALSAYSYASSASILMPRTEATAYVVLESVADNNVVSRSSPIKLGTTVLSGFSADTLAGLKYQAIGMRDDQHDWNGGLAILTAAVIQLNRGVPSELVRFAEKGDYHNATLDFKADVVDYLGSNVAHVVSEGPEAVERCLQLIRELVVDGPTGTPSAAAKSAADELIFKFVGGYKPKTREGALQTAKDALSGLEDIASAFGAAASLAQDWMELSDAPEHIESEGKKVVKMVLNPGNRILFTSKGSTSTKTVELNGVDHTPYVGIYTESNEASGFNLASFVVVLGDSDVLAPFSADWSVDISTNIDFVKCLYRLSGSVVWHEATNAAGIPTVNPTDPNKLSCTFDPASELRHARRSGRSTNNMMDFGLGQSVYTTSSTITSLTTTKTTMTAGSTFTSTETTTTKTTSTVTESTTEKVTPEAVEWQGDVPDASISSADGKAASFNIDSKLLGSVAGVILVVIMCLILGYRSLKKRNHKVTAEEHAVWADEVDRRVSMHAAGKTKNHLFKGVSEAQGTAELRESNTLMTALRTRQLGRKWKAKAAASKSAWGAMPSMKQNHINAFPQAGGRVIQQNNVSKGFADRGAEARSPQGRLVPLGTQQTPASPLPNTLAYDEKVAQQEAEEEAAIKAMTISQQFNARSAPSLPPVRTAANPNAGVAWLPSQDAKDQQRQDETESSDSDTEA
jgi:hypothetical protein